MQTIVDIVERGAMFNVDTMESIHLYGIKATLFRWPFFIYCLMNGGTLGERLLKKGCVASIFSLLIY